MNQPLMVGAGAWGTAFANYIARYISPLRIWALEEETCTSINQHHVNRLFLPDIPLSPRLTAVSNLEAAATTADPLIFAVPSKYARSIFKRLQGHISDQTLVNLSKGFESDSLKTVSQVAVDIFGDQILNSWITVCGPSFARELAQNFPTAVVAVSSNEERLKEIQVNYSTRILRIYRSDDLIGLEVGSSLKNIIAIASGIINGLGYGYNTVASLVTRANIEISRLGIHLGANKETFWGLAGIGDLMLTCFGPLSRNYQLGVKIALGQSLAEIEKSSHTVAEGVETSKAIFQLSQREKVEMPICQQIYLVLFEGKDPQIALQDLMERRLKKE